MTKSSFTTIALAGNRVLVRGTDVLGKTGETVVDGSEWAGFKLREQHAKLHEEFDAKVEEFFAPLTEAAAKLASEHVVEIDPLLFVVEQEATVGREARTEVVRQLSHDSVILRALESGAGDRLVWVGDSALEVTAAPIAAAAPVEDVDAPDYGAVAGDSATSAE